MPLRCTVLDDYQGAATAFADWSTVSDRVTVRTLREHVPDEAQLAQVLHDDEIVVIMCERTAFPESLFDRLPRLRLLVTTGFRSARAVSGRTRSAPISPARRSACSGSAGPVPTWPKSAWHSACTCRPGARTSPGPPGRTGRAPRPVDARSARLERLRLDPPGPRRPHPRPHRPRRPRIHAPVRIPDQHRKSGDRGPRSTARGAA